MTLLSPISFVLVFRGVRLILGSEDLCVIFSLRM